MATTLGLDVGTNSIGWALIHDDEPAGIQSMGVRIFSEGVNIDQFGKETSKNAQRRSSRLIRRQNDRYKLRRKRLLCLFEELQWPFDKDRFYTCYELYALRKKALDEKLPLQDLARIFMHLNQRRGFQSNRKVDLNKDEESNKELGKVKQAINELETAIEAAGARTIGEYFFGLVERNKDSHNPDAPVERIRNRYTSRVLYQKEFNLIWEKQKTYYPEQLTGSADEKYLMVNGKKVKTNWKRFFQECIFYQRPLKSQKNLVGHCRFEPGKRCCPKSSFDFQEFRIWQRLADIRVTTGDRIRDALTLPEKQLLANELATSISMKISELKAKLGMMRTAKINFQGDDDERLLSGNRTNAKFSKLFGEQDWATKNDAQRFKLWHTYLFALSDEWLREYAVKHLGMSQEQAKGYVGLGLEPGYSSISQAAIKKILPHLKAGMDYANACRAAGYHHSYDEEADRVDRPLHDKIEALRNNELRNPIVQQAVAESIRLVNQVIRHNGRPDHIRVELARELRKPKKKREEMRNKNNDHYKQRLEYCAFLNEKKIFNKDIDQYSTELLKYELWLELGCDSEDLAGFVKASDFLKREGNEKFRLWLECDRISPYSGRPISLTQLFSPEIEIDHIIPYSKSMDDSFINKTLAERAVNQRKENRLPYQYFTETGSNAQWKEFVTRVKSFKNMSDEKIKRLLLEDVDPDFRSSQLVNTAYIGVALHKKLKTICAKVEVTNGVVTSKLRRLWGLNTILNKKQDNKSRDDHRHHAIDALVVACTTPYFINVINRNSQFDEYGRLHINDFKAPWSLFREEADANVKSILISYRKNKRLLATRKNILKKDRGTGKYQKTKSVRGPLHQESNFGNIELSAVVEGSERGEKVNVIRKNLEDLKTIEQIANVIDGKVREVLEARVMQFDGNVKKAFANLKDDPVYMYSKKGVKVPIRKVRVMDTNDKNRIPLRPAQKLFVSSGNSYMLCIYEDHATGKRDYETIRFYDAVMKKKSGAPLYPLEKNGKKLLLTLQADDPVVVYDQHPDEINLQSKDVFDKLYYVIKFDVNGNLTMGKHHYANIKADKDAAPVVLRKNYKSLKAIKVKVDLLGHISRA